MAEPPLSSSHNSMGSLCAYRYLTSCRSSTQPLNPRTSFVTINEKRSFRPPPFILHSLVQYFPDSVPLAFATVSPAVRLYTESSGAERSGSAKAGFYLDGYHVTREPMEPFIAPCDQGGIVEDDAARLPMTNGDGIPSDGLSASPSPNSSLHVQAYPLYTAGLSSTLDSNKAECHRYPYVGYHPRQHSSVGVSIATSSWANRSTSQRNVSRSNPSSACTSPRSSGGQSGSDPAPNPVVGDLALCNERCSHSSLCDLSLCASLRCTSTKGLQMVLFSTWWLSRYYGIYLTLEGLRHSDQLVVFKEIIRLLSVKQLTVVRCTLTQEWMQSISSCSELTSLTFVRCAAENNVPLMFVDSILAKPAKSHNRRMVIQSGWYLSGNLSVGVLPHLKCLHIVHTPLQQAFVDSLPACASQLECVMFHKCRHITSLDALASLPNLKCLSIQSSSIVDQGVSKLGQCRHLQRLFLVECRRLTSLDFLAGPIRRSLRELTVSHNWFADVHMQQIANCTNLRALHLYGLKRLANINALVTLTELQILSVGDTAVTSTGLSNALQEMRVARVNLSACMGITSVSQWIPSQSSYLTSLDLSRSGIQNDGLSKLASCYMLRFLDLSDCTKLTSIAHLKGIRALRWLSVAGTNVSDRDLNASSLVPQNGRPTLRYLDMRDCVHIHLLTFVAPLRSLEYLQLENTGINDAALDALGSCRAIQYLNLSACGSISDVKPLSKLGKLRELHLSYTGVTSEALTNIQPCRALEVIHLCSCDALTSLTPLENFPVLKEVCIDYFGQDVDHGRLIAALSHYPATEDSQYLGPSRHASNLSGKTGASHSSVGSRNGSPSITTGVAGNTGAPNHRPTLSQSWERGGELDSYCSANAATAGNMNGYGPVVLRNLEDLCARKSAFNPAVLSASLHLTHLDISDSPFLTDLAGIGHLSSLTTLNLSHCTALDDGGIATVGSFGDLERLFLTGCVSVTNLTPLSVLANLEVLDAASTSITDVGLTGIGQCRSLKYISLADCRFLSDVNALGALRLLRVLHLESTAITNDGIAALSCCESLERLYLTKCRQITAVSDLYASLRQLEMLDVYGTSIPTRIAGEPHTPACSIM